MPAYSNLFKRYLHRVFIETGSYQGDGIQMAFDAGFEKVYSIELVEALFLQCVERFEGDLDVRVIFGDSANELMTQRHRMQTVIDLLGKIRIADDKKEPEQLPYVR